MGPDELAAVEKAKEEAKRQAKPPDDDSTAGDVVETVLDVATSGVDIGQVAGDVLDVAGSAVGAVAEVAGTVVGGIAEAVGSVLDGL